MAHKSLVQWSTSTFHLPTPPEFQFLSPSSAGTCSESAQCGQLCSPGFLQQTALLLLPSEITSPMYLCHTIPAGRILANWLFLPLSVYLFQLLTSTKYHPYVMLKNIIMACLHCYLRSNLFFFLKRGQSGQSGGYFFPFMEHSLYLAKIILFRSQPAELHFMHEGDLVTKYLHNL